LNEIWRVNGEAGLGARDGEGQNESRAKECGEHNFSQNVVGEREAFKASVRATGREDEQLKNSTALAF
jgi:hypothetical protein